jgi:protein required for attachment to host cells
MDTTWIVSADSGRARIFAETAVNKPLQEIEDITNSVARVRTLDTITDKMAPIAAGKSSHGSGGALPTSQYEPQQTPEDREMELFAKEICTYLQRGKQNGRFDRLALVAAPAFLGALRKHLDPQLKPLISYELNKDYTHSNAEQLRAQIHAHRENA